MGPTNVALVKLYEADQSLREAQSKLDAAAKGVRIQERRVRDHSEQLALASQKLKEAQAKQGNLELDIKTRDAKIEKLRSQQQNARNNKEYQTFLIEINTEKVDKSKVEDELIKAMEEVEKNQTDAKALSDLVTAETAKLNTMKAEINDTLLKLQGEVDALRPARDQAAAAVPPKGLAAFDRLADKFEGEAMSALAKPNRRREEYVCTACNMDLVTDVYNKLHSRDDLVFCPSCHRILYIPDDLPPEVAVHLKKPEKSEKKQPASE